MKVLTLIYLVVLVVAGCASTKPLSSCPTDDLHEYLLCEKPTLMWHNDQTKEEIDDSFEILAEYMTLYCEGPTTEWVPVLDESVKKVFPEVKEFLKTDPVLDPSYADLHTIGEREFSTLDDDELYSAIVSMYVLAPIVRGMRNWRLIYGFHDPYCFMPAPMTCQHFYTQDCVAEFEFASRDGVLVKHMKKYQERRK